MLLYVSGGSSLSNAQRGISFSTKPIQKDLSPSAIETVLLWYSKPAYSDCCAYILAIINYSDNPVTDIGRDRDAYIVNNPKKYVHYGMLFVERSIFGDSLAHSKQTCLVQDQDGYDHDVDWYFRSIEKSI